MKKLVLCLALLSLLVGCGRQTVSISGNEIRAGVVRIAQDSQECYICDYFPTIAHFDSITVGEGIQLESLTDSTFVLTTRVPLSTLTLWQGASPLTLVVEDGRHFTAHYPRLYSTWYKADQRSVGISYTSRPTTIVALWQNTRLSDDCVRFEGEEVVVTLPDNLPYSDLQRSYLRVYGANDSVAMSDILLPLEYGQVITSLDQLNRHDPETQILYSLLIDRFNNGNTSNDWQYNRPEEVLPQADYQGGDVAGITQKIEQGFFDSLGINTIWVSPITQNPYDVWGQYHNPETKFTGYHGYWPIYITKVEERFTTSDELRTMLSTAHSHQINVILDYVANHLHINSPLFQQHPDWATDSITPDGRRNFELWDEFRLTTWFDVHIPSLDLTRPEVADQLTDSALYWVKQYDFDGYRHDACKHIPLNYWRTFTHKLLTDPVLKDKRYWMIGETYGNADLIGSYVKSGMLNAQFDFNVYHCAIDVFTNHWNKPMTDLAAIIDESGATYGSHHTMGNISGNHDKARFVSLAGGDLSWDEDPKAAGWNRHVGVGDSVRGYAKQLLLNKLNLTIPGVPCIYQGDEYGQEGANDPDNRRFMRFGGYNRFEQHNLEEVRRLAQFRRNSIVLQFGDYIPLYVDDHTLVFLRSYLGEGIIVGINNSEQPADCNIVLPNGFMSGTDAVKSLHINPNDVTICSISRSSVIMRCTGE